MLLYNCLVNITVCERLAKNDFGSVFQKTAVFGSVFLHFVLLNVYDARNDVLLC